MDITTVKNEPIPAEEMARVYGTDPKETARRDQKKTDRSDFKRVTDTSAVASSGEMAGLKKGIKTVEREKVACERFQKKLEKAEKLVREIKEEKKEEKRGKGPEKKEKGVVKPLVVEKAFSKEALQKKWKELQDVIRKELKEPAKFSGEKRAGLTKAAKELEASHQEFLLMGASSDPSSPFEGGAPDPLGQTDLIQKLDAVEEGLAQDLKTVVDEMEGGGVIKPKVIDGPEAPVVEVVEEVHEEIKTTLEELTSQLEILSLPASEPVVEEKRAAESDSLKLVKTERQEETKKAHGLDEKTIHEMKEIADKIATLKAALTKVDKIRDQLLQLQAVKELKREEIKKVLEELVAEGESKETADTVPTGGLIQASSVGDAAPSEGEGKILGATGASEKEAEYIPPTGEPLVQATGGTGEVGDLSGTGLVIAASNDAMSQEVKNDLKKVKSLIEKLILALQSGNTSVLTDILILLGLKRKESLINAASVVVKSYQQSEKQSAELTKQFEALATEKNPSTAQLASLNSQQQAIQMFNTAAMGFLREALSQLDAVEESTSSILNLVGQQTRQLARFQA